MPASPSYLILAVAACAVAATTMSGSEPAAEAEPTVIRPQIGEAVSPDVIHLIERPGLYGVSDPAPGTQYAVIGSSLVRLDAATYVVRSIIRGGVQPVD